MVSDELYHAMELLLRELTPKQRLAILLSGMDYTAQETAQMTGTSEDAVKAALRRARKRLERSKHEDDQNIDDDRINTYITVLQNGNSEKLIDLYQREIMEPLQISNQSAHIGPGSLPSLQQISGAGLSYILVAVRIQSGKMLFIPFYRSEWLNLWLTQGFSFAA